MPNWTQDQQRVIASSSKKLICSAAAGSGKTAVMIERIVRLIREGADPFSFLVITFTNAAAAEMKEKIRKRLMEERRDPVIAAAAEKAAAMEVCTIHAFCQHLIRQEFQIPGVDPLFRICSSAERDRLFEESFRQACEQLYAERQEAFFSFKEKYEPAAALEIVRTVHDFMMSLPEPLEWLRTKAKSVPLDYDRGHPWFRTVADMIRDRLLTCQVLLRRQMEMFDRYERIEQYRSVFAADLRIVDAIGRWTDGKEVSREELSGGFVRLPGLRNLNDH